MREQPRCSVRTAYHAKSISGLFSEISTRVSGTAAKRTQAAESADIREYFAATESLVTNKRTWAELRTATACMNCCTVAPAAWPSRSRAASSGGVKPGPTTTGPYRRPPQACSRRQPARIADPTRCLCMILVVLPNDLRLSCGRKRRGRDSAQPPDAVGRRTNGILPYLRAPASSKRLLGGRRLYSPTKVPSGPMMKVTVAG